MTWSFQREYVKEFINPTTRYMIVGWTRNPNLDQCLAEFADDHKVQHLSWDYQRAGRLFLLNSHPDSTRTENTIVVKTGFARSASHEPLSSSDLAGPNYISPDGIKHESIHGNPLILGVNVHKPIFRIYQGLASITQMYYWSDNETILCSDTLRLLAAFANPLELNPNAIPLHLMYRALPSPMTYIKNVSQLQGGQMASFCEGDWHVGQVKRIDDLIPQEQIDAGPETINEFEREASTLLGSYVNQICGAEQKLAVLLSGGVDSTLLASLVKAHLPAGQPLESLSYHMHVPSFTEEVKYAQHASELLKTRHQFYDLAAKDYPQLVLRATRILAQPVECEQDPCYLALAQFHQEQDTQYFLSGSGSDVLLGLGETRRLTQVMKAQKIPWASSLMRFSAQILNGVLPNKAFGLREAAKYMRDIKNPLSPHHPVNFSPMLTELNIVEKLFDRKTLRAVMEYKLKELNKLTQSTHLVERVHFNFLAHHMSSSDAALNQFFRLYGLELVDPYLDSDFIRLAFRIKPDQRYYLHGQGKWIPTQTLRKRHPNFEFDKPKLSGGFDNELYQWMKNGVLRDLVESIDRPGYINQNEFKTIKAQPGWMTWNLLTLDLFEKSILKAQGAA